MCRFFLLAPKRINLNLFLHIDLPLKDLHLVVLEHFLFELLLGLLFESEIELSLLRRILHESSRVHV